MLAVLLPHKAQKGLRAGSSLNGWKPIKERGGPEAGDGALGFPLLPPSRPLSVTGEAAPGGVAGLDEKKWSGRERSGDPSPEEEVPDHPRRLLTYPY